MARRDIDHPYRADRRNPIVGFINRDEASILYASARLFAGRAGLEIGAWRGWSTAHLIASGLGSLHVVEPLLADPEWRAEFETVVRGAGGAERPSSFPRTSPEAVVRLGQVAARDGRSSSSTATMTARRRPATRSPACPISSRPRWSCSTTSSRPMSRKACGRSRAPAGSVMAYQTAQMVGVAWRGDVAPVAHRPDPTQSWSVPEHLRGIPIAGAAGG